MTNNLEHFRIKHFSYSQASMFIADPARWFVSYVLGHREPTNAAMERGKAVEYGIDTAFRQRHDEFSNIEDAIALAITEYNRATALAVEPESRERERALIDGMVRNAYEALKDLGDPETYQEKIEVNLEGVHVPIVGFIDWTWPGLIIDLKTSTRLASKISAAHRKQGALYRKAKGNHSVKFLYVTDKKSGFYELENDENDLKELHRAFLCMQNLLGLSRDAQEIAAYLCPDYDSFYWNNQQIREIGREVFGC